MSENVKEITDANFDDTIKSGIVLVDFWAPWCGPCRMQGPILEEVAGQLGDKATITKLNVDDNAVTATKYGIRSIPTLLLFKDGEMVQQFVGVQRKEQLIGAIEAQS